MVKSRKIVNSKAKTSLMEDWLAGKGHLLQSGDVVVSKRNDKYVGVIQFALARLETYQIKWHLGPNPWDVVEGETSSSEVIKRPDLPNPLKYKWSQRVPGPSSDEIDRLEAIFAQRKIDRSPEEVEAYVSYLEEELKTKKRLNVDETKVDSIVDETLEEDTDIPVDPEGVNKKILNILEEE